jgi:hypothetical protein
MVCGMGAGRNESSEDEDVEDGEEGEYMRCGFRERGMEAAKLLCAVGEGVFDFCSDEAERLLGELRRLG